MVTKEIFLIGLSFIFSKAFFFIIPYLVSSIDYKNFNENYYSASLMSMLAIMGIDYVYARYYVKIKYIIYSFIVIVLINAIIFSFISGFNLFVLIMSLANLVISLTLTKLLYNSKVTKYFQINLLILTLSLSSLFISFFISNLFTIYTVVLLVFSIFLIPFLLEQKLDRESLSFKEMLSVSLSIFMINSSAGFLFNFDKYIVNNFLDVDLANAFTFSWLILVPAFYVGNVFEKFLYAKEKIILSFKKTFILNLISIVLYVLLVNGIVFFGSFIPQSIDLNILKIIILKLSLGIIIISIIHYPLNAVLLKSISPKTQKQIAFSAFLFSLLAITLLLILTYNNLINISSLVIVTVIAIVGTNIVKSILINKELNVFN